MLQSLIIRYGIIALLGSSLIAYLYFTYALIPVDDLNSLKERIVTLEDEQSKYNTTINKMTNEHMLELSNCNRNSSQNIVNDTLRRIHEVPVKLPEVNTTNPITYYY